MFMDEGQMDLFTGSVEAEPGPARKTPASARVEPYHGHEPCAMCVRAQADAHDAGKTLPTRRRPRWRVTTPDGATQILCRRVATQAEHDR